MKVKAILRSLFLAYLLSGVCLLLLALLVFKLDIGKGPVTGRNFSDLCAVLPGRRIFGRKNTSSG